MTSKTTKLSFPNALVSSTLGTVLVSMISVWLATAVIQAPATDTAKGLRSYSPGASSHRLFRVPLVPPGADWTA